MPVVKTRSNKAKARLRLAAGLALLLFHAACATIGDSRPHRPALPGYIAVPLHRSSQNELLVNVLVNGRPAEFLVDTGAPHVGLEQARIASWGVEPAGGNGPAVPMVRANGQNHRVALLQSLEIGGIHLERVPAVLLDIAAVSVSGRPASARTADGILGLDVLTVLNAVVDCSKPELLVHPGKSAGNSVSQLLTSAGWKEVPLSTSRGHLLAAVKVNKAPTDLVVDTGAGSSVLDIRFTEAHRFQLSDRTFSSAGIHFQSNTARAMRLNRLCIGEHPVNDSVALVFNISDLLATDARMNGMLGVQTLAGAGAIIDCKTRKIYVRPKRLKIEYSFGN